MPNVLKQNKENLFYVQFPDKWIKQFELAINTSDSVNEVKIMSVLKIEMEPHSGFGFHKVINCIIEVCQLQNFVLILKQNEIFSYPNFVF